MREILFRGKRTDNGEWVEGYLDADKAKKLVFIRTPREIHTDVNMVDPDTVGQYTGLTDKNGKKIFEGDVVLDADEPCEIVFEDCCWKEIYKGDWWSFINEDDIVEIIGNIHDHPELLKGGEG